MSTEKTTLGRRQSNRYGWRTLRTEEILFTRTALRTPARVQRAAAEATNVHGARKPAGDDRTQAEYRDQHQQVQEQLFQAL